MDTQGTELIEGCKDELSGASGRLKLSDLNDLWGDTLSAITERGEKLKEGLQLAESYQVSTFFQFCNSLEIWLLAPLLCVSN